MNWTSDKPTVSGWYWHRSGHDVFIVSIYIEDVAWVELAGTRGHTELRDWGGEWYGPLVIPL